jgi:hypothetical protein
VTKKRTRPQDADSPYKRRSDRRAADEEVAALEAAEAAEAEEEDEDEDEDADEDPATWKRAAASRKLDPVAESILKARKLPAKQEQTAGPSCAEDARPRRPRRPDFDAWAVDMSTGQKGCIGAAWQNDDGSVSVKLNPFVVLDTTRAEFKIRLYPIANDSAERAESAERRRRGDPFQYDEYNDEDDNIPF